MDEIDRKIIEILRRNGRVKYTEIAREMAIPEATVRYRVRSLINKGLIKRFTIELASKGITCLVGFKAEPKTDIKGICERILDLEGVECVYEVTGEWDGIVIVEGETPPKLNETIDQIRAMPGVISTNSFLVLVEHR